MTKVHHRSLPFNKRWPPLRKRRWWSLLPLRKFWGAQNIASSEKGQFFFTPQSSSPLYKSFVKAPLDACSLTLGRWTTAAFTGGRWLNVAQTLVGRLSAFYERARNCWNGVEPSITVINFGLALVWRCLCRSNVCFCSLPLRQRCSNDDFIGAPLRQRPCFPHFVQGESVVEMLSPFTTVQGTLQKCGGTRPLNYANDPLTNFSDSAWVMSACSLPAFINKKFVSILILPEK